MLGVAFLILGLLGIVASIYFGLFMGVMASDAPGTPVYIPLIVGTAFLLLALLIFSAGPFALAYYFW